MCKTLFSARVVLLIVAGLSVFSLAAALVAQLGFDMKPCAMCIYQRVPFVLAALFGVIGLAWGRAAVVAMAASALAFAVNTGLATYHTGIEQGWWQETEGCKVSFNLKEMAGHAQNLMERITNSQAVSCADIPWQDPLLGLSMANYNIILCFGLTVLCIGGVIAAHRKVPA